MKTIKLLITVIFIMALSLGAKAQDKYEYATVIQMAFTERKGALYISAGDKYEEREIKIEIGSLSKNLTPIIDQVDKMNQEGWEVYANNFNSNANGFIYYLRKKKS